VSLVDVARRVVVRTNRWPGFQTLYRQAYDLGLAFTVNRLRSVPGVLAVMLRANDDGRAWVPGLSDYDVTVLTERHEGPRTIQFLDRVWERYRAIKRSVPQLGEMEVMDVEEYGDFVDFGPTPTASLKRMHPLFVRAGNADVERALRRMPRPPQPGELLLDALSRFGRFVFPAWLDDDGGGNSVTRCRTAHLLGNVSKRLARLGVPAETLDSGTIAHRMVKVFHALAQACRVVKPSEGEPQAVVDPDSSSIAIDVVLPLRTFCEKALRQAGIRRCSAVAWIANMSVDRLNLVFVVPDDVPAEALTTLLVTLRAMNRTLQELPATASAHSGALRYYPSSFPTVASESTWRSWRELSPFDGVAVAANGRTLIGATDGGHSAPSLTALRRGAQVEYASLLPLKNNWRPSRGRPPGRSYAALVNHVNGCTSAFTGRVRTVPAPLEFTSTQEGYLAAVEALKVLRAHLPSR
jgi:hypothetical protein